MQLTKSSRFVGGCHAWDPFSDYIYTGDDLQTICHNTRSVKFSLRIKFTYEFSQNFLYEVRHLRFQTTNCTHVEIGDGILEKTALGENYTDIKLTYPQPRRVPRSKRQPLKENAIVFTFYNTHPYNKLPFSVDTIEINDELSLKRKASSTAIEHHNLDEAMWTSPVSDKEVTMPSRQPRAGSSTAITRLPTLCDLSSVLDQDGSSSSGCGSMQRSSTSSSPGSFHNNEYYESPHKRLRYEQPWQMSKRRSFPSPNLVVLSQHGRAVGGGYVDLTKSSSSPREQGLNSIQTLPCQPTFDSTVNYFINIHWTMPPDQFDFEYFQYCYNEFLQQKRLHTEIDYTERELMQKVGKFIKDQKAIAACPLCTDFFRIEELSGHTPMCCELDDLNSAPPVPTTRGNALRSPAHANSSLTIIEDSQSMDHCGQQHDRSIEYVETTTPHGSPEMFHGIDVEPLRTVPASNNNFCEIEAVPMGDGTPDPMPQTANSPEIICVGDSDDEIRPIRTNYPHFDMVRDDDVQCPLCYMKFRKRDIERHSSRCCDTIMAPQERIDQDECYGTSSSMPKDHPSTYPSKNRRVIKPRL